MALTFEKRAPGERVKPRRPQSPTTAPHKTPLPCPFKERYKAAAMTVIIWLCRFWTILIVVVLVRTLFRTDFRVIARVEFFAIAAALALPAVLLHCYLPSAAPKSGTLSGNGSPGFHQNS